jgi:hypothetical protein
MVAVKPLDIPALKTINESVKPMAERMLRSFAATPLRDGEASIRFVDDGAIVINGGKEYKIRK